MSDSDRLEHALCSLEGLSTGDAFGERFFVAPQVLDMLLAGRALPAPPWNYTDDTEMAISIVEVLRHFGTINQDDLVRRFAERYDPSRGYGPAMHRMLARVRGGEGWRGVAGSLFEGQGSYGNGAAMRVAPVGGYFADDLDAVVEQASRSAEVTHAHPEGVAGAIAVAVAAAWAWRVRDTRMALTPEAFLERVLEHTPRSTVRGRIARASGMDGGTAVEHVAAMLGSGELVSAEDTVPFALWCAAHHLDDYEEALWATVGGRGDRDTTCAIVGGIVSLAVGIEGIPAEWRACREPLP